MTTGSGATITPRPNGPYVVTGTFKIVDSDGKEWVMEGDRITLCRCGGSNNKPFCDLSHRTNGFASECKVP